MKNTRKFAAMIAALTLSACSIAPMAMNVSAAATENTISFSGQVAEIGHTYKAYRIFDGTVKTTDAVVGEDGTTVVTPAKTELTGIKWAKEESSADFLAALKADTTIGSDFTSCTNAAEVAKVLGGYQNDSVNAKAFAKLVAAQKANLVEVIGGATITADTDGYYVIIEDSLTGNPIPTDSAMTSYLLAVYDASAGAEIEVKSAIPTVIKKIKENTTLDTSVGTTDNNMADYTIPANYNDTADFSIGDTVPFQIVGSMPSNIADYKTYKYIFHDTLDSQFTLANDFDTAGVTVKIGNTTIESSMYTVSSLNNQITITFTDIKSAGVELTADSKVVVDYSATLSNTAVIGKNGQQNKVYLEYSNNPNFGGEGETDTTSKTPEDKVIAFTYELDVTKIDGANKELKLGGAEFKLKATDGEHANKWAIVDDGSKNAANKGKITGWADSEDDASILTSATEDGIFKVIGLDDGAYSLTETKAPSGYNKLTGPIAFTITANTSNNQNDNEIDGEELTALKITVGGKETNGNLDTGIVAMDVENNSGSTLPSTGGMGTTLFYLGGGAMVAVAGVFLITKKRMGKSEN